MAIKNLRELGENLQKIMKKLMQNQRLMKLLYYTDKDPLGHEDIPQEVIVHEIYEKFLRVTPKLDDHVTQNTVAILYVTHGYRNRSNREFRDIDLEIEIFCPLESWFIKSDNLRPFMILGEIQDSLEGLKINGMGQLTGGDYKLEFITDDVSAHTIAFNIIAYD